MIINVNYLQTSLLLRGRHYCGAVIIAPEWLLTAAHCVYAHDVSQFSVLLGSVYSLSSSHSGRLHLAHQQAMAAVAATSTPRTTTTTTTTSTTTPSPVTSSTVQPNTRAPTMSKEDNTPENQSEDLAPAGGGGNSSHGGGSTTPQYPPLMMVNVEKLIIHENFTRTDFFRNDIALVK